MHRKIALFVRTAVPVHTALSPVWVNAHLSTLLIFHHYSILILICKVGKKIPPVFGRGDGMHKKDYS